MFAPRVVPVDNVLPQLSIVLDAQIMQRVFDQQLKAAQGNNQIKLIECKIERVKYRPKRNCIVGYLLKIIEGEQEREQRLCVGIYARDEAQVRYKKALHDANLAVLNFAPVTLISPLNMVLWAFPNERKLSALPLLLDSEQLREKSLAKMVHERWGNEYKIVNIINNLSNYFPEHSCCVNLTLHLQHATSGALRSWEIIGKTRYDDAGAETFQQMVALWDLENQDVSYARPLAYQSEYRLLWQERVPGETLNALLTSGAADHITMTRVARAIAALHSQPVTSSRRITINDLTNKLITAKETITVARPSCSDAIEQIVYALSQSASYLREQKNATLHGDLHSNNILVNQTQIHLIDMDGIACGPPLADLGSFLAEMIYRACLNDEPLALIRPQLATVIEAYRQRVSWPVTDADVAWFIASALIHERVLRCVTSLKPGRIETIDNLLAAANRIATGFQFTQCVSSVECTTKHTEQAA
jgi:tRNA A-37 threonylcarbamoyl transferase component Bud32